MSDMSKMTVKELQDELDSRGISFNKKDKKSDLLALLESGGSATGKEQPAASSVAEPSPAADNDAASSRFQYAVVRTGGKQYQVAVGDRLRVELLHGNAGDSIQLTDVLVLGGDDVLVGRPVVQGARVVAKIAEQGRANKVVVFKKKRRKGYKVKHGHRQHYTALTIEQIVQD